MRARLSRLAPTDGFTLIELLVVIVIIGILLAIAVPSYFQLTQRAKDRGAQANIRSGIPSAEAYYSDHATYVGMDIAAMQVYDSGINTAIVPENESSTAYCLKFLSGSGQTYYYAGPGGAITTSAGSCTP